LLISWGFGVVRYPGLAEARSALVEAALPEMAFVGSHEEGSLSWAAAAKQAAAGGKGMKVILLGGKGEEPLNALSAGTVDAILALPFTSSELQEMLARLQGGKFLFPTESLSFDEVKRRAATLRGRRFLVAEDNPQNQLVLQESFDLLGVGADFVDNGQKAVDRLRLQGYDAVLMDVQMPVMDGPDATREIRRLERETGRPRTPIIALTANAMAHHHEEYLSAGMDVLVPKPLQLERLLIAIQQVLEDEEATA
jgi:CheY-like chemotaxis protein